ncbi:odorant receptor Or2-like [Pogonomyrmex barbatus]|uniref:Odorant receptor n=1 Tax=Pogonomyrmex barbatus TaxID=144034 RepID=A0A8N1S9I1_9HYME|nr:odorant receptor Or2-like [Pogonomyrmex barbatus]
MLVHILREHNVNKILLSHLGLWPFQNNFIRNFLPILYLVCETSYFLLEVSVLYNYWEDAQVTFETFYHIVSLAMFIIKLLNEFLNRDKIQRLYETMEKHWNIFTSEFERSILKDYSITSRKFSIFYLTIIYSMSAIFIIVPLKPVLFDIVRPFNESRPRVFAISIDWIIDKDKYFVPLLCYSTSVIMAGVMIIVGTDSVHVTRTVHACSLFSIISQQFENIISKLIINEKINESCSKSTCEQTIYQEYVICLKKYQLALQFVDLLNSIYRTTALILLFLIAAFISLVGVRVVSVLDQLEEAIRYSFGIIGMLVQLLVLCYFGQMLIDESQNVFHRIYAAEWYKFSPRLKSLLIITLHRSFIPCSLTAGNIIPLSMTTYAMVLRASMSYFTTFLSLRD